MRLYPELPKERGRAAYGMIEGRGVEQEVQDLLYALVRMNKPDLCIETGLLVGDSAEAIGRALRDNGRGKLITCDIDPERIGPGRERLKELPVEVVQMRGFELIGAQDHIDFLHIDSGDPAVRLDELRLVGEHNIPRGGIVCWHDACTDYFEMYNHFSKAHDWPHLVLPSVVGFAVFHRPE